MGRSLQFGKQVSSPYGLLQKLGSPWRWQDSNQNILTSYKNQTFYDFLHQHHQPPFCLNNDEGKHHQLACCCMAVGWYINPATGSVSVKMFKIYIIILQEWCNFKGLEWLAYWLSVLRLPWGVLNRTAKCHGINKCLTIQFTTSPLHHKKFMPIIHLSTSASKYLMATRFQLTKSHGFMCSIHKITHQGDRFYIRYMYT